MAGVEQQFDEFFKDCARQGLTTSQLLDICQPLVRNQRKRKARIFVGAVGTVAVAYLLISRCDCVSWGLSALGRLFLIQLLPFWDWTTLYNTNCLIERPSWSTDKSPTRPRASRYETEAANCVLCESLDHISTVSNANFSFVESSYLERGLPVIITDSHAPEPLRNFRSAMQNAGADFVDSEPCDVATNLMLRKLFNVNSSLQKIESMQASDRWFLQLRNCDFNAVKASRLFVKRPYYYPLHLKPFYSSWVLMSHNYNDGLQELYLQGLVLVQQLSGSFKVELRPKQPCASRCPAVSLRLTAGEALLFSTDLWIYRYSPEPLQDDMTAIATLLEIDWSF